METLAQEWLRLDRDPATRSEIEQLMAENNHQGLEDRLSNRLAFGTAGLRARMGAGVSRINRLTIIQTSQGLASYLLHEHRDVAPISVVIGYDARHNSKYFAELAASAFIAKGIKVWWYEDVVHTPLVSLGVQRLDAVAGIMIPASHNPACDNGYKVYGSNGCQINAPVDRLISNSILQNLEPITWDPQIAITSDLRQCARASMIYAYQVKLRGFFGKRLHLWGSTLSLPPFAYTPMHGVGLEFMNYALDALISPSVNGASSPMVVAKQQAKPDPDFPTVRYPNPEEEGALDLAKSTADQNNINLVLANDPDADRLAVAEKVEGTWYQFTGDEVGVLLASHIFSERVKVIEDIPDFARPMEDLSVLTTAVSSSMLGRLASYFSVKFEETLTGFKWLGNRATELGTATGWTLFAYEEALGYMFPNIVRDKDGIAAACIFLAACKKWQSPYAELQRLYSQFGYHVTMNTYWRSPNMDTTAKVFEQIRASGSPHPYLVAEQRVLRWRDLTTGYDSDTRDHQPLLPCSSSTQMITCWLPGLPSVQGTRCTIRASGTEPKIKLYLECRASSRETALDAATATLKLIKQEWFNHPDLVIEEKYQSIII